MSWQELPECTTETGRAVGFGLQLHDWHVSYYSKSWWLQIACPVWAPTRLSPPSWPNLNFLDLISDSEGEEGQIKALEHPSLTQHACQGQQPSSRLRLACTWWASALLHEPDFSETLSGFSQLINSECCACVCLYMTPAVGLILTDWLSQLKLLPLAMFVWFHPSDLWQLLANLCVLSREKTHKFSQSEDDCWAESEPKHCQPSMCSLSSSPPLEKSPYWRVI